MLAPNTRLIGANITLRPRPLTPRRAMHPVQPKEALLKGEHMKIEMTPNGVGSAVHELLRSGMPLDEAIASVSESLRRRDGAFLRSDLVTWLVRQAEQNVWLRHRPLAVNDGGAEEGHPVLVTHRENAPSARLLSKANPLDFEFFVPGVGRKRFGACTVPDLMKIHDRWHKWGRTLITKAQQIKAVYQEMADRDVEKLDDLGLDGGSPMLTGLV